MKQCTKCLNTKPLTEFHKKSRTKDGLDYYCKVCSNEILRKRRVDNKNSTTIKYEKTLKGKLVRTYRNMVSRVEGILKSKAHLYKGLDILEKEEFYSWSLNNKEYIAIYTDWVNNDYSFKLSPSIDRVDPTRGYTIDNIRWVTHSQNSSNTQRHEKKCSS